MDWLLAAHQVAPLQYEMGGLWNPVSVRDQMVRGQEIARRAAIAQLIGPGRPLIVVGAGAGGVAAALTADIAGIPVFVIERGGRPFDAVCSVVDCVVGMAGAIDDDAARSFAVGFYRALGNRRSVGNAVDQAVATLAAKGMPAEVLPRCLTRQGVDAHQVILDPS